jgi:hypothetical protein
MSLVRLVVQDIALSRRRSRVRIPYEVLSFYRIVMLSTAKHLPDKFKVRGYR